MLPGIVCKGKHTPGGHAGGDRIPTANTQVTSIAGKRHGRLVKLGPSENDGIRLLE